VVSITAAGKKELGRLRELTKKLENEFFAPLDSDDRHALRQLLQRLASHNDPRCASAMETPPGA
jgi:DNA-binding MarR family transcriptional regulator